MRPTVYIETTIPSYLTARPSRDLVRAAQQAITREWWERRGEFDLFVSEAVLTEVAAGDPDAAARRADALAGVAELPATPEAAALARALLAGVPLPPKAAVDALHVALAAVAGMDFLLTWNCTHIANAVLRNRIEQVCRQSGYEPPVICTPAELVAPPDFTEP